MCEEFHRLPSEILREQARAPAGLLEEILDVRAYTAAYFAVQAKDTPRGTTPTTSAMEVLVREIEMDLAKESDG